MSHTSQNHRLPTAVALLMASASIVTHLSAQQFVASRAAIVSRQASVLSSPAVAHPTSQPALMTVSTTALGAIGVRDGKPTARSFAPCDSVATICGHVEARVVKLLDESISVPIGVHFVGENHGLPIADVTPSIGPSSVRVRVTLPLTL